MDPDSFTAAVTRLLEACGLDPSHPDLAGTPRRVVELWKNEFLAGYGMRAEEILADPIEGEPDPDAVFVTNLSFHALCPHHLLPYQGKAHVAYLPRGKIVGFSRIGQLVACFTRRLTLQERATHSIAKALMTQLSSRGAACVLESNQLCLGIPNDEHASNWVTTTAFLGDVEDREDVKQRLLSCVRGRSDGE